MIYNVNYCITICLLHAKVFLINALDIKVIESTIIDENERNLRLFKNYNIPNILYFTCKFNKVLKKYLKNDMIKKNLKIRLFNFIYASNSIFGNFGISTTKVKIVNK